MEGRDLTVGAWLRRERVVAAILLILGLGLRLGVAALAVRGPYDPYARLGGDTEKYVAIGLSLTRGEGYSQHYRPILKAALAGEPTPTVQTVPTANRSPGYPLFLALVFATLGTDLRIVVLLQALLSALTPLFVYLTARELKAAPLFALACASLYYPFAFDAAVMMSDWLFTLVTAATLWLLVRGRSAFLAGLVAGVALLVKSVTFPFFVGVALSVRRRGRFALGLFLVALPWGLRNLLHTGIPRLAPPQMGEQLFLLHNPSNRNLLTFEPPGDVNELYPGYQAARTRIRERAPRLSDPVAQEYAVDREFMAEAVAFIAEDPIQAVRASWRSFLNTWRPEYPGANAFRRVNGILLFVGLMPLAIWGSNCAARRGPDGARLLLAFLLYFCVVHSVLVSQIRYRTAAMPAYFVLAALGLANARGSGLKEGADP